jgi:CBS domain-containing protein
MSIAEALSATPVSSVDLTRYVAVPTDISVGETVGLMCAGGRSSACVVDDEELVGMFTQRDILQRVIGRPASWHRPIREEMTQPVHTIGNTASVADGLAVMNDRWIRSVPVLDQDERLVGNLSFYTVISTIGNLLTSRISGSIGEATVHHGLTMVDFTGLHTSPPVTFHVDDPVELAIHHMQVRGLGSVLVVDDRENLVGELTEFDLLTKVGCVGADLTVTTVGDVMTPDPVSLDVRSTVAEAIHGILEQDVSHIPLTAESGRPVGVASFRDIATFVETSLETLG